MFRVKYQHIHNLPEDAISSDVQWDAEYDNVWLGGIWENTFDPHSLTEFLSSAWDIRILEIEWTG